MSDPVTEKRCTKCEQIKPIDSFFKRYDRSIGSYSVCKKCQYQRRMESLAQSPKRSLAHKQRKQRYSQNHPHLRDHFASKLRLYGMSKNEYTALLEAQGRVCAICGKPETRKHQNGKVFSLAIDHDHRTGNVRGLLCFICNTRLVALEDEDFVVAANAYLARQQRQQSAG